MSSAARFLLEFEASGDQEVVNKIREVGQDGKEQLPTYKYYITTQQRTDKHRSLKILLGTGQIK